MKNKIYLLSPWCEEEYRFTQISLNYIQFYLLDHGFNAEIIDCAHYEKDSNEVILKLKDNEKPIVGITAYTRERFSAYDLIRKIKKKIPDSLIVVGGRHFGTLVVETLNELTEVDIVVRGEGEITFKEICESVVNNKGLSDILGISYKKVGGIIHNPDRPLEKNLDKFRCFDMDHQDHKKSSLLFLTKIDSRYYFSIYATRGCAGKCVFCSLTAEKVRFRSVDNIINEIEDKIKITNVRNVRFGDSSLTLNKKFITHLCEELIKRQLNIRFNCYSRVDINPDLLKLMKRAGLVSVELALESGSPRILKAIKKNIKLVQFETFLKEAYRLGIKSYVFCMVSFPDETAEDVEMTISLIKKNIKYIYYAVLQTTRILPDAALTHIAKEKGVIPKDFNWFKPFVETKDSLFKNSNYSTIPLYLERLTEKDIQHAIDEFDDMQKLHLVHKDLIMKLIKINLRIDVLKKLTFQVFIRKLKVLFEMVYVAYRNKSKDITNVNKSP